jgi:hypothetical protein
MEVSDEFHTSAALLRYPLDKGLGVAPESVCTLWRREKSTARDRNGTPATQPVPSHYADWVQVEIVKHLVMQMWRLISRYSPQDFVPTHTRAQSAFVSGCENIFQNSTETKKKEKWKTYSSVVSAVTFLDWRRERAILYRTSGNIPRIYLFSFVWK